MARNLVDSAQNFGVLAVLAGALYIAYRVIIPKEPDPVTPGRCDGLLGLPKIMCEAGTWTIGADPNQSGDIVLFQGNEVVPVPTYFCPTLGTFIPTDLTCPTAPQNTDPYLHTTNPNECSPNFSWCEKQGHCVPDYIINEAYCDPGYIDPATAPTTIPYVPNLVDYCQWPNGDRLTVPPGMDCGSAVDDMCQRFGPGYKGCPW